VEFEVAISEQAYEGSVSVHAVVYSTPAGVLLDAVKSLIREPYARPLRTPWVARGLTEGGAGAGALSRRRARCTR
jgi:hypothetical protein